MVIRSVLLKGVLTPRWSRLPESLADLKAAITKLKVLMQCEDDRLPELAYPYILSDSRVHCALVGAGS